jgi:hypothetical protein
MRRNIIAPLSVLLLWGLLGSGTASAQFGTLGQPPFRPRPTVSPFVNLGTGGGAMSYYGIVRPQTATNQSIMNLQNAVGRINADGTQAGQTDQQGQYNALGGLTTGHRVTYFNYSHYYPMVPTGTSTNAVGTAGYSPFIGGFNTFGANYGFGLGGAGLGGSGVFFGPAFNTFQRR